MGTTVNTNPVVLTPAEVEFLTPAEPDTYTLDEIGAMVENLRKKFEVLENALAVGIHEMSIRQEAVVEGLNAVGTMQNQVNEMVQGFTSQASAAMSGGGLGGLLMKAMGGKGTPNG